MILVTGATGFVGQKIMQMCKDTVACPSLRGANEEEIRRIVEESGADVIVHTAAISDIGACQANPEASYLANVQIPIWLAKASKNAKLICFSSDQVYSALDEEGPYTEDRVKAGNLYAEHKLEMEQRVLDIDPDAVMYLVNGLSFDAKWECPYEGHQVFDRSFTTENGEKRTVSMMYSEEGQYLKTEKASGFLKYYEGRRYAFAALLPEEGTTVAELVSSLDGTILREVLTDPQEITVHTGVPKFETGSDTELKDVLTEMGMTDAFDSRVADFSRMGSTTDGTNLCIGRVIHKTVITVAEEGTKAGAATMVEMRAEGAAEIQEEIRVVTLDRPFLYMIVDTENMEPVFIGAFLDPQV